MLKEPFLLQEDGWRALRQIHEPKQNPSAAQGQQGKILSINTKTRMDLPQKPFTNGKNSKRIRIWLFAEDELLKSQPVLKLSEFSILAFLMATSAAAPMKDPEPQFCYI